MISLNNNTLGQSGLELMQRGIDASNAAGAQILESSGDPMTVAEESMRLSQGKVQVAVGAWLVQQQNAMLETSLQIFGIGGKFSGLA